MHDQDISVMVDALNQIKNRNIETLGQACAKLVNVKHKLYDAIKRKMLYKEYYYYFGSYLNGYGRLCTPHLTGIKSINY